ncbi:MAG: GNAT family N-acetyltransferase [Nitrososphaerales archaeon]
MLQFEEVRRLKRLQFIVLEYCFFRDSEGGSALPLSLPLVLSPLSLLLHIVKSRAPSLLTLPCYLVKLGTKTVGLLAIHEQRESLIVASLGVAKQYRRLGIGACILGHVEMIARNVGKKSLAVDVYKKNVSAQRLYAKHGFTFTQDIRIRGMMRGNKLL